MTWLVEHRDASIVHACELLGVPRASYYDEAVRRTERPVDPDLRQAVVALAEERPGFGYRRITAMVRRKTGRRVNEKAVRRVMKKEHLLLPPAVPPRRTRIPKHPGRRITQAPNVAYQVDLKYVRCGRDGWACLQNAVDCCTSEWLDYVFDQRCGAAEAIRLLNRVVPVRFPETGLAPGTKLRVDNGPCDRANAFVQHAQSLGFDVEHIQVQTPQDNGVVESHHAGIGRDYLDLAFFDSFEDAAAYIRKAWIDHETVKPRKRLAWKTPREFYESFQANSLPESLPEAGERTDVIATTL